MEKDNEVIRTGLKNTNEEEFTDATGAVHFIVTHKKFSSQTTEKRKLVEKLAKADKLESLGVLAGGIAHDYNNLLTGIFGFVNLARLNINNNNRQPQDYLQEAAKVLGRAQGLVRQLLTFSKGCMPLKKVDQVMVLPKEHDFCGALIKPYTLADLVSVLDKINE